MLATQANPETVSAFRREEKQQTTMLMDKYLSICRTAKVFVSFPPLHVVMFCIIVFSVKKLWDLDRWVVHNS